MSFVTVSLGSALNSSQLHRFGSAVAPVITKSHSSSGVRGVGPAGRTGKSSTRYWPGGTRPLGPSSRRLPRNPREAKLTGLLYDAPAPRRGKHGESSQLRVWSDGARRNRRRAGGGRRGARSAGSSGAGRSDVAR